MADKSVEGISPRSSKNQKILLRFVWCLLVLGIWGLFVGYFFDDSKEKEERSALTQIQEQRKVRSFESDYLGIMYKYLPDGIFIFRFYRDSLAEKAGVEWGDKIKEINDVKVSDSLDGVDTLINKFLTSGEKISLSIIRQIEIEIEPSEKKKNKEVRIR